MSIYPAKVERRAKLTAVLLAVAILGAIATFVGMTNDRGDVSAASNSIGDAARSEVVHQALGRNPAP